jgi:hypothetical protein
MVNRAKRRIDSPPRAIPLSLSLPSLAHSFHLNLEKGLFTVLIIKAAALPVMVGRLPGLLSMSMPV